MRQVAGLVQEMLHGSSAKNRFWFPLPRVSRQPKNGTRTGRVLRAESQTFPLECRGIHNKLQAPTLTAPTTVSLRVGNLGRRPFTKRSWMRFDFLPFWVFSSISLTRWSSMLSTAAAIRCPGGQQSHRYWSLWSRPILRASAYLITELLLREKRKTGKFDVPSFYLRRMLASGLYFFYIGLAMISVLNPKHVCTWHHVAAFLLFSGMEHNCLRWPIHSIVGPLRTVSIEEQFYLLWAPIVRPLPPALAGRSRCWHFPAPRGSRW